MPHASRLTLLTLFLLLAACSDPADVILYVSADETVARPVILAFEQQTGLHVGVVFDTEQKKTTGLVNRLRDERDRPQADVLWSSEVFNTVRLADEGVLAPYESAATEGWPLRDARGRWYGFAARPRVIVYAPDRVGPDDVPQTWMALTDPRWQGRIVMADPRFGTTGGHLAAMRTYWSELAGDAYYEAFLLGLADNRVKLLPGGNAAVVQAVADGEADVGLTDADDVWAAKRRGYDVEMVLPRHGLEGGVGAGTLLTPNTVALVAGGPHPAEAGRLIDFLLSPAVERMLADSVSHNVPVGPGLAAAYPQLVVPDPLRVSYDRAAAVMRPAIDDAMRVLAGRDPRAGGDAP